MSRKGSHQQPMDKNLLNIVTIILLTEVIKIIFKVAPAFNRACPDSLSGGLGESRNFFSHLLKERACPNGRQGVSSSERPPTLTAHFFYI